MSDVTDILPLDGMVLDGVGGGGGGVTPTLCCPLTGWGLPGPVLEESGQNPRADPGQSQHCCGYLPLCLLQNCSLHIVARVPVYLCAPRACSLK